MRIVELFRRPAEVSGLLPVARLRRRLDEIEPALAENAALEQQLAGEVAALEQTVGEVAHRWATAAGQDQAADDPAGGD